MYAREKNIYTRTLENIEVVLITLQPDEAGNTARVI